MLGETDTILYITIEKINMLRIYNPNKYTVGTGALGLVMGYAIGRAN